MADSASLTDSYLNFLLDLTALAPNTVLSLFILTMLRVIPILVQAPFFGAKNLPSSVKIMFSLALSAILIPQVLLSAKAPVPFDWNFIAYAFKELIIGLILGFLVTIPFMIAQASGTLIDHVRGSSSLQVNDPTTQMLSGSVGIFYNYMLIALFFGIGGPFLFLQGLATSFQILPADSWFNAAFFSLKMPLGKLLLILIGYLMSIAIQLAAPSLVGILMTEMFLGIANRLAPQVQIVFLGIPLKSWVGIFFLMIAWYFILQQLSKESLEWLKIMNRTITQLAP
jgi:type III secretion protein T